jgi:hypothetical protein
MSGYDLLLSNILQMLEHANDIINELGRQNAVHVVTSLNDAHKKLEKVKGEIDEFEETFDADTRYKLINKPHWVLKKDILRQKGMLFKIRDIDLRTKTVVYSYNSSGTSYLREDPIQKFLDDFE